MRQIKIQKTITFTILLILAACSFSCGISHKNLKISEIQSTCEKLPDMRDDPANSLMSVTFEGYLIEAKEPSGDSSFVKIGEEPNSEKKVEVSFKTGTQNNQLQITDKNNFTVKTDKGETLKTKDKVKITGTMGKTKYPQYTICSVGADSIEKPSSN